LQYFFSIAILIAVGGNLLQSSRGNFLLQALLALTLLFAFVPFIAIKLLGRESDALMYATTRQIDNATTAARIYIRENVNGLPYERTVISGNAFSDTLEPYGLPLGFVPKTALGQDISLVIDKTPDAVSAYLDLSGGKLNELKRAELVRRIGFYAADAGDGDIHIGIVLDDTYSDVVRRNQINVDAGEFLVDLDMGGFALQNAGRVTTRRGEFDGAEIGLLTINGVESGRKVRNNISIMVSDKAIFQSQTGESALSLTRGSLIVGGVSGKTISAYGDTGNLTTNNASVYNFSMTAGRTGFSGPPKWNVHGNVVTNKINFSVERLDINSFLNVARGQDVYINSDTLEYSSASGIDTNTLHTSNITLRDQTSDALARGETGAVVLDVRPAGTSLLPDAYVSTIDNGTFAILASPRDSDARTVDCKSIIASLQGVYNQRSLAQYLICQYVYWQRMEKRINIKQCLLAGKSGCI
jgi:hypothetical protein